MLLDTGSTVVYSTTSVGCLLGIEGCDCDLRSDGTLAPFCECHDCHRCGEVECPCSEEAL
jgi:hypothetical protein